MKSRGFSLKAVLLSLALLLPLVASCEVGLGSAVDTVAPTLDILYPPASAIVQDTFTIGGSCKDDIGVALITLVVKNTSTGSSKTVAAKVDPIKGTWSCVLNEYNASKYPLTNGWELADGTYEISVTAMDASGHSSGTSSRTIDIDNTAPVFIISSPGVTKSRVETNGQAPSAYGTVFTVSGTIVDNHEIAEMNIKFFDETGREIPTAKFSESSIPTAGGTEVTIASYVVDDTSNEYYKLYGPFGVIAKNFFCEIELKDSAVKYSTSTPTKAGNKTTDVYLYDDVYTRFLSTKSSKYGLSASNFMSVLNGTYSGNEINVASVKNEIRSCVTNTSVLANTLAFSLNPNADPTYIVNGFDLKHSGDIIDVSKDAEGNSKIQQAGNNNTINISLSAGLDGTLISPASVHTWIYKFNTQAYKVSDITPIINKVRTKAKELHAKYWDDNKKISPANSALFIQDMQTEIPGLINIYDNTGSKASSSAQVTVSCNLPKTIASNNYYIILVTGYDVDGTEIAQSDYFGFIGMSTGERPTIAVTTPSKNLDYCASSGSIIFKGKASKGDADLNKVKASIKVVDEDTGAELGTMTGNAVLDPTGDTRNWTLNLTDCNNYSSLSCAGGSGKNYLYTATFTVEDTSNNTNETSISVHVDATKPIVTISSVTPTVKGLEFDGSANTYVNGKIAFTANVEEINLKNVKYEVYVNGDAVPVMSKDLGKVYSINKSDTQIDTTNLRAGSDGETIVIKVIAEDNVGNTGFTTSTIYNGNKAYVIKQDSDTPIFKPSNFSIIPNVSGINSTTNAFRPNGQISAQVTDDDGIDSILAEYSKNNGTSWANLAEWGSIAPTNDINGSTSYIAKYTIPDTMEEGQYLIKFTVKDIEGNAKGTFVDQTYIGVYSKAPTIALAAEKEYYKTGDKVSVNGTVTSKTASTLSGGSNTPELKFTGVNYGTDIPFTDTVTAAAATGRHTLEYVVTDIYGQTGQATLTYTVDNTLPEVSITSITPNVKGFDATGKVYVNGKISIAGKSSDNYELAKLSYKVYEGTDSTGTLKSSGTITGALRESTSAAGSFAVNSDLNNWTIKIDTAAITKDIFVELEAEDVAGNKKTYSSTQYNLEKNGVTGALSVNQETDRPVIKPNNFDTEKTHTAKGTSGANGDSINGIGYSWESGEPVDNGNLFGTTSNNTISGLVTDDDGVAKVTVAYKMIYPTPDASYSPEKTVASGSSTTASFSYELPQAEGIYEIRITAFDTEGNQTYSETSYSQTRNAYNVGVVSGSPKIAVTTSSGSYFQHLADVNIFGTVSSGVDFTVTATDNRAATPTPLAPLSISGSGKTKNFTHPLVTADAVASGTEIKVTYSAKDIFGQTSTAEYTYTIDSEKPVITTDNAKHDYAFKVRKDGADTVHDGNTSWYSATDLVLTGFYTDTVAGVKKVDYKLEFEETPAVLTPSATGSLTTTTDGNGIYKFSSQVSKFKNGVNYITFTAEDNSKDSDQNGNRSTDNRIRIQVDTDSPIFAGNFVSTDNGVTSSKASGTVTVNGKQKVILYGTITDPASGVGSIEFTLNGKIVAPSSLLYTTSADTLTDWEKAKGAAYVSYSTVTNKTAITGWKAEFSNTVIVDGSLKAVVTDVAGSSAPNNILSFLKDDIAPVPTITTASADINGINDISGTVDEANSPASIQLFYATSKWGTGNSATFSTINDASVAELTRRGWTEIPLDSDPEKTPVLGGYTQANKIYNWSFKNFNFNTAGGENSAAKATGASLGKSTLYILPVVRDAAGNCNAFTIGDPDASGNVKYTWDLSKAITFTVDMNKDRPTLQVTNITDLNEDVADADPNYVLMYGTNAQISGSIKDDDSTATNVVSLLIAAEKKITAVDTTTKTVTFGDGKTAVYSENNGTITWSGTDNYGTTTLKKASGDWTFTPSDFADGTKTVYFYVEDNAGAKFYTNNASTLLQPYFQYKSSDAENNSSALSYVSDKTSPSVSDVLVSTFDSTGTKTTADKSPSTSLVVGGKKNQKIEFVVKAEDSSGIRGIAVSAKCGETVVGKYKYGTVSATDYPDADYTKLTATNVTVTGSETKLSIPAIDLSDAKFEDLAGTINVVVDIWDGCGLKGNGTYAFTLDNKKPTVSITSPANNAEKTGSIDIVGTSYDNGSADMDYTKIFIPMKTQVSLTDDQIAALTNFEDKTYTPAELAALKSGGLLTNISDGDEKIWTFKFAEDKDKFYKFSTYDTSDFSTEVNGLWKIPVYVVAADNLGNITVVRDFAINHNPDGDKPKIDFTYPTTENYEKKNDVELVDPDYKLTAKGYVTLGGTIRLTGSAEIPSGTTTLSKVYVQVADANGKFDDADKTKATGTYAFENVKDADDAGILNGFATTADKNAWWGIEAKSTSSSWYLNINANGKMNPSEAGQVNKIIVRACGVNAEGKVGAWSNPINIRIDNSAPTAEFTLVQYSDIADGFAASVTATALSGKTPAGTDECKDGKYLKGQWFIQADITDENNINESSIKVTGSSTTLYKKAITPSGRNGFRVWIPIKKDLAAGKTSVTYTIEAEDTGDSTPHSFKQSFEFYIDNTAPEIKTLKGNGDEITTNTKVVEKSYTYTIEGDIIEAGSGLETVLFFFSRGDKVNGATIANKVFLDPMTYNTSTDDAKVPLTELETRKEDGATVYGKTVTGNQTEKNSFNVTSGVNPSSDTHIRVGGLIYIGGKYRRIESISGNTVTFNSNTDGNATSVTFIYGQVVDNAASETVATKTGHSFTFDRSSDDGDEMPENLHKAKPNYDWTASIHSINLPDGPATLTILAIDAAGNISATTKDIYVSNSAPRIAKVYLGTNIDRSTKFDDDEFVEYSWYDEEGAVDTKTLATRSSPNGLFTIKNGLAVVPEVIGGNGTLKMSFKKDAASSDPVTKAASTLAKLFDQAASTVIGLARAAVSSDYEQPAFVLTNNDLNGGSAPTAAGDGVNKAMSFTFWDETDETVQGTNSQCAVLYVTDFTLDLVDGNAPTVDVRPFFWKSKKLNSIYQTPGKEGKEVNGHIELEDDLPDGLKSKYGADPKVSGKVVFRGVSYDDVCLSGIFVKFSNMSFANSAAGETGDPAGYACAARYNSTTREWTLAAATMATDGWEFKILNSVDDNDDIFAVSDAYYGQTGHKVAWELSIDTEKVDCNSNQSLSVVALDMSKNKTSTTSALTDSTDGKYNRPSYQMDIVPYVTGVTTKLSSLKTKTPSVYSRTALGHYGVGDTETLDLTGFNLGATATVADEKGNTATVSNGKVAVGNLVSGKWTVKVNNIESLNNANSNDANGMTVTKSSGASTVVKPLKEAGADDLEYYYNSQSNGDNNLLLTDDLVVDVWHITPRAAMPEKSTILEPTMKINQVNDKVGFAFVNGSDYFSMGDDTLSYRLYQKNYADYRYVSFTYDDMGRSFGTAAGLDTEPSYPLAGRFTLFSSLWKNNISTDNKDANYNGKGGLRIDSMGVPTGIVAQGEMVNSGYPDVYRFRSPSITTAVHGSNTSVYLAYVDVIQGQIRLRCGETAPSSKSEFGDFTDNYGYSNRGNGLQEVRLSDWGGNDAKRTFEVKNNKFSLIAGKDYQNVLSGTPGQANATYYDTNYSAGEYVSIAVIPGTTYATDKLVAVWYDGFDCYYSYVVNPGAGKDLGDGSSANPSAGSWRTPIKIFSEGGEHCQIAVDALGGIHIAGYVDGAVKYAYLSQYNVAFDMNDIVTVDNYDTVGQGLSIETYVKTISVGGSNVERAVPVISYYMGAKQGRAKIAYLADPEEGADFSYTADGANSDTEFTGAWEVKLVPNLGGILNDRINVGLWKYTATNGTNHKGHLKSRITSTTGSSTNEQGTVYGNGTSNPIVGYATRSGATYSIETAQMK